jgi:hypothetical protein
MSDFSKEKGDRKLTRFARKMPAAAWVAVGLLGAAIIAPAAAVAGTNLVTIIGAHNVHAGVTPDGQLQTTETAPGSAVDLFGGQIPNKCLKVYTVPHGKALIIENVTFNTLSVTTTGPGNFTGIYPTSSCSRYFLDNNPGVTGEVSVPTTPGIALKQGSTIYLHSSPTVDSEIYVYGYLVPASEVSANHLVSGAVHAGAQHR